MYQKLSRNLFFKLYRRLTVSLARIVIVGIQPLAVVLFVRKGDNHALEYVEPQAVDEVSIYLPKIKCLIVQLLKHVVTRGFSCVLEENGYKTEDEKVDVINKIKAEIERRKRLDEECKRRKEIIQETYKALHPEIYSLKNEYLDPKFLKLVDVCAQPNVQLAHVMKLISTTKADQVYSFPVFTEDFCKLLIEELDWFEKSDCPKGRPNTMNSYGVLLDDLGFYEQFITPLRETYLQPVSAILFPEWTEEGLDSHKAFIVTYKEGKDLDLSFHFDNSEVTLNVALGKEFVGGELYFGGLNSVKNQELTQYEHVTGVGLLHRGRHMHGAYPLKAGERYNLIIWMRSSSVRNLCCPMCNKRPELVETYGFGDGFTSDCDNTVNVCNTL